MKYYIIALLLLIPNILFSQESSYILEKDKGNQLCEYFSNFYDITIDKNFENKDSLFIKDDELTNKEKKHMKLLIKLFLQ